MIPPHLMLNLRQTRLRYASCNAVRAAPGLGLDVSPLGVAMSRWTVLGIVLACLVGVFHGFLEACWELAIGQYESA